jgi:hypothetical protein
MAGIVGRGPELASAARFLDAIQDGPAALVVEGPAGIGKTAVWNATLALAAERSWPVLSCRPAEAEINLSYAGLGDLVAPVLDAVLPELAEPQRRALDIVLLRRESDDRRGPEEHTVSAAVLSALFLLSQSGPLLLAVDDVRWLDDASARVLGFVCRRLRDRPVGVAVSVRIPAAGALPLGLDDAMTVDRVARLRLEPLSVGVLHHIVADRLGSSLPRSALLRTHSASGGNPLLALEIARAILESGRELAADDPLPISGELSDVLAARITALPDAIRRLLLIASASASPTVDRVVAVADSDTWESSGGAEAEAAGVVELRQGEVRFTHPMLASAAYTSAPAAQRRQVHRELADVTEDAELRARHLGLASTGPDEEVARALDAGARDAWRRGAPSAAAELSELALRVTPAHAAPELERRRNDAAMYFVEAGDLIRARELLEQVLASGIEGMSRARALHRLARLFADGGDAPGAIDLLTRAA